MGSILVPVHDRQMLRRALRFECQVVRERDFKLLGETALDVSCEGMRVLADVEVLTGEEVIVSFKVPRSTVFVDTEATVARVVHGRRPSDLHRRAVGLRFAALDLDAIWAMRAGLRRVPPPLPARRPRIDYAASVHLAALE